MEHTPWFPRAVIFGAVLVGLVFYAVDEAVIGTCVILAGIVVSLLLGARLGRRAPRV